MSYRLAAFAARRGEEKMPSPSFTLNAQLRFHDKWLKMDLQVRLTSEGRESWIDDYLSIVVIVRTVVSYNEN